MNSVGSRTPEVIKVVTLCACAARGRVIGLSVRLSVQAAQFEQ